MKVESWQGINGKLVHDEQKAIVVDNDQALTAIIPLKVTSMKPKTYYR